MNLLSVSCLLACLVPASAFAQPFSPDPALGRLERAVRATAPALAEATAAGPRDWRQASGPRRDSVKNGAIIGAVIGGVGLGIFMTYVCHALVDSDPPECWKVGLVGGVAGAGIGGLAGAGIDALFQTRRSVAFRVRF